MSIINVKEDSLSIGSVNWQYINTWYKKNIWYNKIVK
jgi:hypothetical protein